MKLLNLTLAALTLTLFTGCSNAQNEKTTTISGYTIGYQTKTKCGCFFVDSEMVDAGVAETLEGKTNSGCTSDKYGKGSSIDFTKVNQNDTYNSPKESLLMQFHGYWGMKDGLKTYYVTEIEPFF